MHSALTRGYIRHDDGYYYFTATVPEYDRLELRRATTIEGLADAEPTVIWTKRESGPMGAHIWAPELHVIDGKWYGYGPGHNGFTVTPEGEHVLVYHARSYKEIQGDPLNDPNRHTRVQVFGWREDGSPDFGVLVPDTREVR